MDESELEEVLRKSGVPDTEAGTRFKWDHWPRWRVVDIIRGRGVPSASAQERLKSLQIKHNITLQYSKGENPVPAAMVVDIPIILEDLDLHDAGSGVEGTFATVFHEDYSIQVNISDDPEEEFKWLHRELEYVLKLAEHNRASFPYIEGVCDVIEFIWIPTEYQRDQFKMNKKVAHVGMEASWGPKCHWS
ncbi:hypothetical protein BO78DRAFT_390016 [Aspergillus sclerotiicarbonarius CBS 121057]|uniref:Uncharacterized protein n=1 Tax=Aspergillus sclerotiicarbonarius (strain CBS 121057 / IBT 28362) TaxID=1448318 RepID=A0A319DY53_ASPSB|nr:hypothetical protein BO78DRAFT_390016 [Aspergillus sclerotiicarbonarius CBS 121057]